MDSLRAQAELAGGSVVSLLGNHEIMNALNDLRYVTQEDIATFGSLKARQNAMKEGWIGKTWRANYSITAKVPFYHNSSILPLSLVADPLPSLEDNSAQLLLADFVPPSTPKNPFSHAAASFVHGGITPYYLSTLKTKEPVTDINRIGLSILEDILNSPTSQNLPAGSTMEQRMFYSDKGPVWSVLLFHPQCNEIARKYAAGKFFSH